MSNRVENEPVTGEIQVQVRAFAALRQILGTARLTLNLPADATVAEVLKHLGGDHPAAAPHLARAIVAVNHNYVDRTHALAPNDEVAIFPPVSGGATERTQYEISATYAALSADPIDPLKVTALVAEPGTGGIVTFAGVVRDNNLGRQVRYLEYEAYPEMAEAKMRQVVAEARERWPEIRGVAVIHRTGHLEIGEMAVLVAVGSPHRDDGAFEAARYVIDRTKEIVPIWKKEVWTDGAEWLEGDYHPRSGE
jgi:molybdopterin converting factor subunit 1